MCLCGGVPIFLMKFTIFVLWASFRFWGVLVCFCVFGFCKVVWFSYKHLHFFYKVLHFSYKGLRFFDKVLRNYSFVFVRIVLLFTKHMVFWLLFWFGGLFGFIICQPLWLTLLFVGIRILVLWASFSLFLHLQLYFFNCKMVIVHDFRLHLQYYFFNCIIYIQV